MAEKEASGKRAVWSEGKGVRDVDRNDIAETLEKQLKLLFECSQNPDYWHQLPQMTKAMCEVISLLSAVSQ